MTEAFTHCLEAVTSYLTVATVAAMVLPLLAWTLVRMLADRPAHYRHLVWQQCLLGIVLVPLLWLYAPKLVLRVLPQRSQAEVARPAAPAESAAAAPLENRELAPALPAATAPVDVSAVKPLGRRAAPFVKPTLAAIWLVGSGMMLFRLVLAWASVTKLCQRATRCPGDARGVPVLLSEEIESPACFGILQPVILFPREMYLGSSDRRRQMALAHELSHIRRRDHITNLFQRLLESALFFHPLVWWASARLTQERELVCDGDVLEGGAGVREYGALLAGMAERMAARPSIPVPAVALFEGRIPERIRALMETGGRNLARVSRWALVTGAAAAVLFFVILGTVRLGAETPASDAASAGGARVAQLPQTSEDALQLSNKALEADDATNNGKLPDDLEGTMPQMKAVSPEIESPQEVPDVKFDPPRKGTTSVKTPAPIAWDKSGFFGWPIQSRSHGRQGTQSKEGLQTGKGRRLEFGLKFNPRKMDSPSFYLKFYGPEEPAAPEHE